MSKVYLTALDQADERQPPHLADGAVRGYVESRAVVAGDRPLHLWTHRSAPNGGAITWSRPATGRVIYVWEGSVRANGVSLGAETCLIVERDSECCVEAEDQGYVILEFFEAGEPSQSEPAGGRVHVVHGDAAPAAWRGSSFTRLYADGACPTCTLWLHENGSSAARRTPRHFHTVDEILVVKDGQISFGSEAMLRGAVLAVGHNSIYSFAYAETGGAFLNFRSRPSHYAVAMPGVARELRDEQRILRDHVGRTPNEIACVLPVLGK